MLPMRITIGLTLTSVGYFIWAGSLGFIVTQSLFQKRFNKHLALWTLFVVLAPIQFNASRSHNEVLNKSTSIVLIGLLVVGTALETRYYLQRRQSDQQLINISSK